MCWSGVYNAGCSCEQQYGWVVCNTPPGVPAITRSPAALACNEHCSCRKQGQDGKPPRKKLKQSDYCLKDRGTPCADTLWCNIVSDARNFGLSLGGGATSGSLHNPINLDSLAGLIGFCSSAAK
ncbi:MAG: hypothetical protein M1836_005326 [Candelina mexicana]|nr:MAG: hypothetical protein M1836_005326 [Candelina mexicana]